MDLPATIKDVPTPCLLVDMDRVEANCEKMIKIAHDGNVTLRPNMKTCKTVEGGILQTGGTKRRISVSTVAEAEFYAKAGFDDILYTTIMSTDKLLRVKTLSEELNKFHVMIDSDYSLGLLESKPLDGKSWSVFLKVDVGYGRAGIMYDSPEMIAIGKKISESPNIVLEGIYTHEGFSYDAPGELMNSFYKAKERMIGAGQGLRDAGVECPEVTLGSTPSCSAKDVDMTGLTEIHPGNYVFYDLENATLGSCTKDEIAVKVATRIIGIYPEKNLILTDAGFTAHSLDGKFEGGFRMEIDGYPELRLAGMTQELGKVRPKPGETLDWSKYSLGDMLFVYPWHSCNTACVHPLYYCHRGEEIKGTWTPSKGW